MLPVGTVSQLFHFAVHCFEHVVNPSARVSYLFVVSCGARLNYFSVHKQRLKRCVIQTHTFIQCALQLEKFS